MSDKNQPIFYLYQDYRYLFAMLTNEEKGKVLTAIFEMDERDVTETLGERESFIFLFIREQILRDRKKYESICERNRAVANAREETNRRLREEKAEHDKKAADRSETKATPAEPQSEASAETGAYAATASDFSTKLQRAQNKQSLFPNTTASQFALLVTSKKSGDHVVSNEKEKEKENTNENVNEKENENEIRGHETSPRNGQALCDAEATEETSPFRGANTPQSEGTGVDYVRNGKTDGENGLSYGSADDENAPSAPFGSREGVKLPDGVVGEEAEALCTAFRPEETVDPSGKKTVRIRRDRIRELIAHGNRRFFPHAMKTGELTGGEAELAFLLLTVILPRADTVPRGDFTEKIRTFSSYRSLLDTCEKQYGALRTEWEWANAISPGVLLKPYLDLFGGRAGRTASA